MYNLHKLVIYFVLIFTISYSLFSEKNMNRIHGTFVPENLRSRERKFHRWNFCRRNHMVTYSEISNFTCVNQLLTMSKVRKWRNIYERFTLYNYFVTNHTCACSVISLSQLFTSSVYWSSFTQQNSKALRCYLKTKNDSAEVISAVVDVVNAFCAVLLSKPGWWVV